MKYLFSMLFIYLRRTFIRFLFSYYNNACLNIVNAIKKNDSQKTQRVRL